MLCTDRQIAFLSCISLAICMDYINSFVGPLLGINMSSNEEWWYGKGGGDSHRQDEDWGRIEIDGCENCADEIGGRFHPNSEKNDTEHSVNSERGGLAGINGIVQQLNFKFDVQFLAVILWLKKYGKFTQLSPVCKQFVGSSGTRSLKLEWHKVWRQHLRVCIFADNEGNSCVFVVSELLDLKRVKRFRKD